MGEPALATRATPPLATRGMAGSLVERKALATRVPLREGY